MVHKAFLEKLKKFAIPFTAVNSAFLFTTFDKAKAETHWLLQPEGIATKLARKEVENAKNGDAGFFEVWGQIGGTISNIIQWFLNLPENIAQLSVNLLTKLYELLMFILQTPLFIFNNSYLTDASLTFAGVSVVIVSVLTMIEMMKRMVKKRHTDFTSILKRWSVAVVGAGFAPFLFEQSFNLLNIVSKAITHIGVTEINSEGVMTYLKLSGFNTVMLLGFDIVLIALMIPIFLQNFRRFFDLMCLAAITPLALTAWVFDDYRYLHTKWWNQIKALGSVQLIYSVFICLMGIFIFGTRDIVTGGAFFLKMGIAIGGLYRMANVPNFVKSKLDDGDDVIDASKDLWKTGKNVWNTVSGKPFRVLAQKKKEEGIAQATKIAGLRKKHGRRFVGDLM